MGKGRTDPDTDEPADVEVQPDFDMQDFNERLREAMAEVERSGLDPKTNALAVRDALLRCRKAKLP